MRVEVGLHVPLLRFGRLRWAFWLYFWRRLSGFLGLQRLPISCARNSLYDLAPWWWLFIRDDQFTFGAFVKVIILGMALRSHSETKEKSETNGEIQSRASPPSVDSTGLWAVSCGWSYASPLFNVAPWSTFLEGTAKIHIHMLVVAPVKVRNSIDITSISEITKTTAMTTLSTSLKLSFTDVVETAPWRTDRATPVPV